jgi:hypothetical protein
MIDFGLILNILAFFFLMIPYFLAAFGKWKGNSYKFIGCNIIGGIIMMVYFMVCIVNPTLILLNLIWVLGGIIQILRKYKGKI